MNAERAAQLGPPFSFAISVGRRLILFARALCEHDPMSPRAARLSRCIALFSVVVTAESLAVLGVVAIVAVLASLVP